MRSSAYLVAHPPAGPVLALTEPLVAEVLAEAGFALTTDPAEAAMVVVSWDRGFDYAKLLAGFRAVRSGARIVATNPDPFCPTADGGLPDCAAMLAALEACTGARAEAVVGKPSRAHGRGHPGASRAARVRGAHGRRPIADRRGPGTHRRHGQRARAYRRDHDRRRRDRGTTTRPVLARLTDIIPEGDDTRYQLVAPAAPEARA